MLFPPFRAFVVEIPAFLLSAGPALWGGGIRLGEVETGFCKVMIGVDGMIGG
jgi:hypothetical protein